MKGFDTRNITGAEKRKLSQSCFAVHHPLLFRRGRCYGQNSSGFFLLVWGQSGNFQRGPFGDLGISLLDNLLGFRGQIGGGLNKPLHSAFADAQLIGGTVMPARPAWAAAASSNSWGSNCLKWRV